MDRKAVRALRNGFTFIRDRLNPEMPVQQLALLMEVICEDGITMPELSKRLKMSPASVSKNVRMLSRFIDKGELKGYDLLRAEPHLEERRKFAVYPTNNGIKFVEDLMGFFGKDAATRQIPREVG